jgi:hypothetical protein
MKILDRLPIDEEPVPLNLPGVPIRLKPFQIGMHVSILDEPEWNSLAPIIPALLDTGNNHNFSIQEHHLTRWAGIHPDALRFLGVIRDREYSPSLRFAKIWIHRNRAGTRDLSKVEPFLLRLDAGIAVYPSDKSNYPRLPLLGLRAILDNDLKLVLDGKRNHVSLKSSFW